MLARMGAAGVRRTILGTAVAGGLGLVGAGASGVLALDGDLQAAERPQAPRSVPEQVTRPATACPRHRPRPQRTTTRHVKV